MLRASENARTDVQNGSHGSSVRVVRPFASRTFVTLAGGGRKRSIRSVA
jgi:hypothetical protein